MPLVQQRQELLAAPARMAHCEAAGLHAFARGGQASFVDGYDAHERAVQECRQERQLRRMVEEFERLRRERGT